MEAGRQALRSGDTDGIRRALDELNPAYSAAGAALYQAAGSGQPGEAGPEGQPAGQTAGGEAPRTGDVVDADYEIVDEKK